MSCSTVDHRWFPLHVILHAIFASLLPVLIVHLPSSTSFNAPLAVPIRWDMACSFQRRSICSLP